MVEIEKQLEKIIDRKMDEITDFIFTRSQENIIKNESIDTGMLLRSGNVNRSFLNKEIVYTVPYAPAIEYGSQPHAIYSVWLHDWVRRKLNISDEREAARVAFAIAKKIELEGIDARPFLRPAIQEAKARFGK